MEIWKFGNLEIFPNCLKPSIILYSSELCPVPFQLKCNMCMRSNSVELKIVKRQSTTDS